MVPPALTYRARLRIEGSTLAVCGVAGSVVLLLTDERSTANTASTVVQLVLVLVGLAVLGPAAVRRSIARAEPGDAATATGEPTPLWQLPLVVVALTTPLIALGAWDAGLRVTAGCTLVGLAQALLLTRVVRADERATRRTYVRTRGSRIGRGTRLVHVPAAG